MGSRILDAAMRKEVIILLAATSSVIGNAGSLAHVTLDSHAREITPRMIIWNICIAPRSGSALSIYSRTEDPMRAFHDVATQEDLCVSCADYAAEARDGNTAEGSRSAVPQAAVPTWSACEGDGSDDASGL
jgi:hypothetical protein